MEIRPAVAGDAESLVPLFEQWSHPLSADEIRAQLAAWRVTPRAEVLVAQIDDAVVGFVAVVAIPHLARLGRFARLGGMVVSADRRRGGIGRALMGAAEQRARAWGCERLELTSSRTRCEAHSFYPALGYDELSERQARYRREL